MAVWAAETCSHALINYQLNCELQLCLDVNKYKLLTNQSTKKRTPCSRVIPEKLTISQLNKKFPTFYGTQRFISFSFKVLTQKCMYVTICDALYVPLFRDCVTEVHEQLELKNHTFLSYMFYVASGPSRFYPGKSRQYPVGYSPQPVWTR
jgi:hypothetical protein